MRGHSDYLVNLCIVSKLTKIEPALMRFGFSIFRPIILESFSFIAKDAHKSVYLAFINHT